MIHLSVTIDNKILENSSYTVECEGVHMTDCFGIIQSYERSLHGSDSYIGFVEIMPPSQLIIPDEPPF